MNKFSLISLLSGSLAVGSVIQAEWYSGAAEIPPSHWYQLNDYSIDSSIPAFNHQAGRHIYSGYKASDLFSIQLEYQDRMQSGASDLLHGRELWLNGQDSIDIDRQALFLSGQSTFSIDESSYFYLRGGVYNPNIAFNKRPFTDDLFANLQDANLFYSIGSYYDVADKFSFSAAWKRFEFDDQEVDVISTQFHLNF